MSLSLTRVKQMVINGKIIKRAGNSTYSKTIRTTLVFCSFHEKLVVMRIVWVNSGAPGGGEYEISVLLVTFFVFL
jgi:hypothetical protein